MKASRPAARVPASSPSGETSPPQADAGPSFLWGTLSWCAYPPRADKAGLVTPYKGVRSQVPRPSFLSGCRTATLVVNYFRGQLPIERPIESR
jgi:hypothetical protein